MPYRYARVLQSGCGLLSTRSPISTPWSGSLEATRMITPGFRACQSFFDGRARYASEGFRIERELVTPVAIGLGSNLGDRQANVAAALQRLRAFIDITRVSSAFITTPVGYRNQPDFLNLACIGTTALAPRDLRAAMREVERRVGRGAAVPMGPRAIDLDLLLYGDLRIEDEDLTIPHRGLQDRAFVLIPLAEIAPDWRDPVTDLSIATLASRADPSGVTRSEGGLLPRLRRDIQEQRPSVALSLDRAGVTGVKALIALDERKFGRQQTAVAIFDIFADLDAAHSGVHMSRFSQDLEDALAGITAEPTPGGVDALALAL